MLLFDDYEKVKKFLASPLRDVHNFTNLLKEYKSLFMRIDRHANQVIFTKCEDRSCCQEWRSTSLQEFLLNFKMLLFAPSITTTCDHYDTFLQSCMKSKHNLGSTGQPSSDEGDLGKCEICTNYWFLSKTEKARHKSLFHRRQKLQQPKPRTHSCDVCEASFSNLSSLNRHKKGKQHTSRDQRKRQQPNDASGRKKRKTKARTIQDMLRANRDVTSSDDESDEEACSAPTCCIKEIDTTVDISDAPVQEEVAQKIIPNISDSDQDADKDDEEMLDDDLNRDEVLVSIGEYVGAINI